MGPRLSENAITPNSTNTPQLKRRRQGNPVPDLPSPPTSNYERPPKKRRIQEEEYEDEDIDPLRPPRFWDKLSSPIPLVRAAVAELDRRNKKASLSSVTHWHPPDCDIQRYARQGGPDLSDIRAGGEMPSTRGGGGRGPTRGGRRGRVQKPRSRGTHSSLSKSTKSSKATTGPYDAAFKQHLINHYVWPIGHYLESGDQPPRPNNFDALVDQINNGRASLEPETFTRRDFDGTIEVMPPGSFIYKP
ncbi:hypothetical protein N0V93_010315 [Gnomoniopsis smithogilvyi]|uniref:Uncharacterized protein n=1 Tax=Gnomoniopsis smithogilvyi TaxID=1191159 RepID=A0A9W8YKN6_9PEZI|nr:hypothetical protein N0V93_010315 [Gnomoniopsis smithogilvyi]